MLEPSTNGHAPQPLELNGELQLLLIPLDQLRSHPKNPRLFHREEVVEAIRTSLQAAGEMSSEHALRVRPVDDFFQIISGHHRCEAARRAGLAAVPCWVRAMDDDEAYMALVLDNRQGELSPLEIGLHALEVVGKAKAGRGKKGGLTAYAKVLGQTHQYLSQLVAGAQVAKSATQVADLARLAKHAKHLFTLHALPASFWPELVEKMLASDWSVADTEKRVAAAKAYLAEPVVEGGWDFLRPEECALAIALDQLTAQDICRLADFAASVDTHLHRTVLDLQALADKNPIRITIPNLAAEWMDWLEEHRGKDSWDIRKLRAQRDSLEERLSALRRQVTTATDRFVLVCGNLADVYLDIEGASVDCIITDPPYAGEHLDVYDALLDLAQHVLKPGGCLLVMVGQFYLPEVLYRLESRELSYHWTLAYLTPGGQSPQIWPRKVNTFWKPVLCYVKGKYQGEWVGDVVSSAVNDNDKRFHEWGQSESGMKELVERFSSSDQLVCDPFLGGGTTGLVALRLGRKFLGIDINPECLEQARTRFLADKP